jgi:hypothetical protein
MLVIQPSYYLARSDFWLFPTRKTGLKGIRFGTMHDMKLNATAELRKIANKAYQHWQDK